MPLIDYDMDLTAELLLLKKAPVMETTIMRELSSFGWSSDDEQSLFVRHFSLFHVLYRIKSEYGKRGYYMHIDTMRLRLCPIPKSGCSWYDAQHGTFCGQPECRIHTPEEGIVPDYFSSFYLDAENLAFESMVDYRTIDALIYYGCHKHSVDEALEYFGVTAPDKKRVCAAYRKLAVQMHPDHGGSEEAMKTLNGHFTLLKKCFL